MKIFRPSSLRWCTSHSPNELLPFFKSLLNLVEMYMNQEGLRNFGNCVSVAKNGSKVPDGKTSWTNRHSIWAKTASSARYTLNRICCQHLQTNGQDFHAMLSQPFLMSQTPLLSLGTSDPCHQGEQVRSFYTYLHWYSLDPFVSKEQYIAFCEWRSFLYFFHILYSEVKAKRKRKLDFSDTDHDYGMYRRITEYSEPKFYSFAITVDY